MTQSFDPKKHINWGCHSEQEFCMQAHESLYSLIERAYWATLVAAYRSTANADFVTEIRIEARQFIKNCEKELGNIFFRSEDVGD